MNQLRPMTLNRVSCNWPRWLGWLGAGPRFIPRRFIHNLGLTWKKSFNNKQKKKRLKWSLPERPLQQCEMSVKMGKTSQSSLVIFVLCFWTAKVDGLTAYGYAPLHWVSGRYWRQASPTNKFRLPAWVVPDSWIQYHRPPAACYEPPVNATGLKLASLTTHEAMLANDGLEKSGLLKWRKSLCHSKLSSSCHNIHQYSSFVYSTSW